MDMATEMMETEDNPSPSSSSRRLAIKNNILTNFGDDYVFQVASSQEISTMAVSLSTNTIKLYSPVTAQYLGECKGHRGTINEISFSMPESANVICSCSSDGTVRAWDTRIFKQVSLLRAGSSKEIYSFCIGGSTNNLLAAGCSSEILFWDVRNGKQVLSLEESHIDDVTKVQFAPNQKSKLISSSVDGLLCIYDTDGHIDVDEHLESVMNVGTSISRFGFFGQMNRKLWCLTHIETLSIWDWQDGRKEVELEEARSMASDSWNLDQIDYFVDCFYSEADDRMWVIGGTNAGTLGYFPLCIDSDGSVTIGSAEAILEGGHTGIVRTILPVSSTHGNVARSEGIFAWTGGEDGHLCCWSSDDSSEVKHSWISSTLAMRSPKFRKKKHRHHPY